MPHHALCDTGNFDFYRFANAQTLVLPTSSAADRAMNGIYFDRNAKNRWAYKNATTILKAYEGTQETKL
jgi:hypothetical protein